jgi:hypothetical protein
MKKFSKFKKLYSEQEEQNTSILAFKTGNIINCRQSYGRKKILNRKLIWTKVVSMQSGRAGEYRYANYKSKIKNYKKLSFLDFLHFSERSRGY